MGGEPELTRGLRFIYLRDLEEDPPERLLATVCDLLAGSTGRLIVDKGGRAVWFNPFLDQRLAEERMKDAQREAEQARLIRAAKGARKVREWPLLVIGKVRNVRLVLVIQWEEPKVARTVRLERAYDYQRLKEVRERERGGMER